MPIKLSHQQYDKTQYSFGTCYVANEQSWMYIPIEKNVSKIVRSMCQTQGFGEHNFHQLNLYNVPSLVILRDPLERWVSGLVEYLLLVDINVRQPLNNLERLKISPEIVREQIVFDAHTFPQSWFLQGLASRRDFILFDESKKSQFVEIVSKYFSQKGLVTKPSIDYAYQPPVSDQKRELTKFYNDLLNNDQSFKEKIKNFYAQDYDLIDSVKFYT